jgi:hypothetical protein
MVEEDTLILVDHQGRDIRLTGERRVHIMERPELADQLERIVETLAAPDSVVATPADETVHVYHKHFEGTPVTNKFLLVAVKMLDDDAFILTAFFSSRQKRGVMLWPK